MTLVLMLAAGRSDIRMPDLGHPPPGQLNGTLIERRLELEQQ